MNKSYRAVPYVRRRLDIACDPGNMISHSVLGNIVVVPHIFEKPVLVTQMQYYSPNALSWGEVWYNYWGLGNAVNTPFNVFTLFPFLTQSADHLGYDAYDRDCINKPINLFLKVPTTARRIILFYLEPEEIA